MSAMTLSATQVCVHEPTLCVPTGPRPERSDEGLGGLLGLLGGREVALPLVEVRVRTEVVGFAARTVVEQRFHNAHTTPIEAVHLFPLSPRAAVVSMSLLCGDLEVHAECRAREEAEQRFAEARSQGHRAGLLTQERPDVHTLRVTALPPGETVRVRFELVELLDHVDGRWQWRFPTVVAPRYTPGAAVGHEGPGVGPDTDAVPDASRLQPPLRLSGGTKLDLEVTLRGAVRDLSSSQHAVRIDLDGGADAGVRIAPSGKATLNGDFVLAFGTGEADRPALRAYTDGTCTLVCVEPPARAVPRALPRDAMFVVDISGSMEGEKMVAARAALKSALHGLSPGDRFRLIAFDDRLETLSRDWSPVDDAHLARADRWIDALAARGGTEMLPAIQAALEGTTPEGRLRTVLFVTDGQATDEARLGAAVANRRGRTRFFTLGIDTAVNESLLGLLARLGGGVCELATPQDDIERTVARLESRFGLPALEDLRVLDADAARPEPLAVFAGRPATALVAGATDRVRVEGLSADGPYAAEAIPMRVSFSLGALWARARIAWLEDRLVLKPHEDEALKPEITRLGVKHQLATRFTAFIAVETTRKVDGTSVEIVQPVEKPMGWAEGFGGAAHATGSMPVYPPSAGAPGAPVVPAPMMARMMVSAPAPAPAAAAAAPPKGGGGLLGGLFKRSRRETPPPPPSAQADAFYDDDEADGSFAPSSMAFELEEAAPSKARGATEAPDALLARTQRADGSYGGDVARTAAALLALVLLGNGRRRGPRARVVAKAAAWLEQHRDAPLAVAALDALEAADEGRAPTASAAWEALTQADVEGHLLAAVRAQRP
jgi:Ca-activated chloride channel family protein